MITYNNYLIQFSDLSTDKPFSLSDTFVPMLLSSCDFTSLSPSESFSSLIKQLFNKYHDEVIGELNKEPNFERDDNGVIKDKYTLLVCQLWLDHVMQIYEETKERYETVINAYKDAVSKIMSPVETTSTSKTYTNDTPQNVGGIYEDDTFTSAFAKAVSSSTTDVTKMSRLMEIQQGYEFTTRKWLEEFRRTFLEDNYE